MVKRTNRWLSLFLSAALVLGGIGLPAAPSKTVEAAVVQEDEGREVNFNKGWKFCFGDLEGAEAEEYDDTEWEDIVIPHDFSITQEFSREYEGESGFLPGGTGWYRKSVVFPKEYNGKSLVLNFDGVYNHAYVYVNGTQLGENHYGYTDFAFDITDYVTCDGKTENVIAVKAYNSFPSSRWYSGSGIYRDVTLYVTDKVHVAKNGTYVTTPDLEDQNGGDVRVNVEVTVQNDGSASTEATVRATVLDAQGKTVSQAPVTATASLEGGASAEVTLTPVVTNPQLWDCDNPNLYYVKTEVLVGGAVKDTYMSEFGFRYFSYDANNGFSLNGKYVKLKGVCMHHDQGGLGSAAYYDAVYRQVKILKEMGCNSIRTSHNTPSKVLVSVCNKLGILVQEEFFDGWAYSKNGNTEDFGTHFRQTLGEENKILGGSADETWAQFALEATINRDKNDPSIITWSLGNELPTSYVDGRWATEYPGIADSLIGWAQAIDKTRPITHGDNACAGIGGSDARLTIDQKQIEAGGIVGLNYPNGREQSCHNAHPTWPLVSTETASSINSRGIYDTRGQYGSNGNYQCTAYDTWAVSWGNRARHDWYYTIRYDFIAGEYVWTGFDYIGEPTPWNGLNKGSDSNDALAVPNSSYFGIVDTAGFPKDSYYLYASQWRDDVTTLHLVPGSWNEDDLIKGGKIPVNIYSNAAKVELYLNDELIGTATRKVNNSNGGLYQYGTYSSVSENKDKCEAVSLSADNALAVEFNVTYEEGTLSAKAYDEQGDEITDTFGTNLVETNSDQGTSLKATAEKTEIQADGSSLCYIAVDVLDAEGRFVPGANNNIRFNLTGNGTIVAVDNGNPSTINKFQQKSVLTSDKTANIDAFSGKALVIVRSTEEAGGFTLDVSANDLEGTSVTVDTIGEGPGKAYISSYDLTTDYSITMGETPKFQTQVKGTMTDGSTVTGTVVWDKVSSDICNTPGQYSVNGVLTFAKADITISVTAYLEVLPIIVAVQNYSTVTVEGHVPSLPKTLPGVLPTGSTYGSYDVSWNNISAGDVAKAGTTLTVNGAADVKGIKYPVTASVRVAEDIKIEAKQIAAEASLTASTNANQSDSDSVFNIIDGNKDGASSKWTNYSTRKASTTPNITFTWPQIQNIDVVKFWFYDDNWSATAPVDVTFEVSTNGSTYSQPVEATHTEITVDGETTFTFKETQRVKSMRITLMQAPDDSAHSDGCCVGISECEVYTSTSGVTMNSTALLNTLTANGKTIDGFAADKCNAAGYQVNVPTAEDVVVAASAGDNASVTIVPVWTENGKKVLRILVVSEDGLTSNIYKLIYEETNPRADEKLKEQAKTEVATGEKLNQKDYSPETWSAYQAALKGVRDVLAKGEKATKTELDSALTKLRAAYSNLKKTGSVPVQPKLPKVGSQQKVGKASYKVTKSASTGGTVTYMKPDVKTAKKITIPATVTISGVTFKVTAIAAKAFKNNKKLTNVTIGNNVKTIGKSAFEGDGKLKKIRIKSTVLSKVGKKAFKGINAKAKIKVPKKCLQAYKKKLKGKGQKSSVKIQK